MKVTKEKIENSQAFITVEMEPPEMETAIQASYHRLAQRANVPGFRKGKAPRAVLERHLGRPRLLEEAIDQMLPEAYEKALTEQSIEPYARPNLEITQMEPLIFKAVVPLRPNVELGDYQGIRVTPEPIDIKEENIDAVIEQLRHQHATWEPVARPLDYNDLATIDINGEVDGRPYVKRLASQYQVIKESITPAPGFAEKIAGMKKEEEREFDIVFPADYPGKEIAGKTGHFKVKLNEAKEEKLPEVNDEFAAQVSPELKTVVALREEATKGLKLRAEENVRMDVESRAINAAIEQSKIEYPPVIVDMEIERILNDQARQLQMTGRGMDEYLRSLNKTPEQLSEDMRPVAEKNVKASLVLGKIAETEKIEVNEADIQNGINNMVRNAGEKQEEFRRLLDNPQTRESMKQTLLTRKTIERLAEIAKGESKPVELKVEAPEKDKKEAGK